MKTKFLFLLFFMFMGVPAFLPAQTTVNIAPSASAVSASYTASWNNLNAINNGTIGYGLVGGGTPVLSSAETWGSWNSSSLRLASQWLEYNWANPYLIDKVTVYFWADNATMTSAYSGVAIPASWKIQYWDAATSAWVDVTLATGQSYTRNIASSNTVQFNGVTTTKLRLNMNAQSNATPIYAAIGVTEWQVFATVSNPTIMVNTNRILLSDARGKETATFNVKGVNIPSGGISLALSKNLGGASLSATSISQADAQSANGYNVTVNFAPEQGKTDFAILNLTAGGGTTPVTLVTSKDNDCFAEAKGNLIYDSRFLTMDRFATWSAAPTIVNIAENEDVKCGATCLKFTGKSGVESKSNIYLTPATYKTCGWIKTNGTFETGIYGTGAGFTSTESAVVEQTNNHIYFLLPDTKGEWKYFEYSFNVKNAVLGGAWVNNGHSETSTLTYLDNWQIYNTNFSESVSNDTVVSQDYPIQPVSFVDVKINDNFWAPRIKRNQDVTIPIALEQCYSTGRVDNFKKAGGLIPGYFSTEYTFDDTDIYKILEGMSYSVQSFPNAALEAQMDTLIYYIGKAQEPDGYLYTARTAGQPGNYHAWVGPTRWVWDPNLSHELYNCGHLYEAAVAHYKATGKRTLLDIAIKNADLLVKDFLVGGLTYEPGHQIVEMGLVKMYRVTGKKEYLQLAKYFLDLRGTKGVARTEYSQSNIPVVQQKEAVGHAVRAVYMYSGMADVAALTNDKSYLNAIDTIWQNAIYKKYYITGGIGAKHDGEAFDKNYVLPNATSYCETCAAIGHVYWNHRLFLMHGDAKYYDVIERNLYNGVISGISLSGDHFFYPNPLQSDGAYLFNQGTNTRQAWFGCACCPSNLCRFTASVPGYVYAQKSDSIYVNLYVQGNSSIKLGGNTIHLSQVTNYPWEGNVTINVTPEAAGMFDLLLRVPGWAQNRPVPGDLYSYLNARKSNVVLKLNGNTVTYTINDKGYIVLSKIWQAGDKVELSFPMDVHRTIANANVAEDKGKVSLERGPIVYAMEWADNDGHVFNGVVADNDSITTSYQPDKLTGIVSLQIAGKITSSDSRTKTTYTSGKQLTAIPYFAWDNRGIGEMAVWMARTPAYSKATPATDTLVYNVTVKPDFGTNNTNYPYTIVSADKQAVYNALGLQQSDIQSKLGSTVIYGAINPTGLINTTSTAGSPGHWFDKNGAVTVFNSNATVYSELDLANLAFRIGLRPGLSKEGDMFTIKQALTYTPDNTATRVAFKFNVTVTNSTGINELNNSDNTQIFTTGHQLYINNTTVNSNIVVCDLLGRRYIDAIIKSTSYNTTLASGIYIVSVGNTKKKVIVY